jgi:DNA-binding response OmpR family regulator
MLHSLKLRAVDEVSDLSRVSLALDRHPYDLVLIDEQLGGEDGYTLIRNLRRAANHPNRHAPIIMMAATPSAQMIAAARDAGVSEFLRKPFSAHHIELRLEGMRNKPREFVEAPAFAGPDRRRSTGTGTRRASDGKPG